MEPPTHPRSPGECLSDEPIEPPTVVVGVGGDGAPSHGSGLSSAWEGSDWAITAKAFWLGALAFGQDEARHWKGMGWKPATWTSLARDPRGLPSQLSRAMVRRPDVLPGGQGFAPRPDDKLASEAYPRSARAHSSVG